MRNAAATALSALIERHYVVDGQPNDTICGPIVLKCKSEVMSASNESIRIGYAIALGKTFYIVYSVSSCNRWWA